jgi:hypothetical protein
MTMNMVLLPVAASNCASSVAIAFAASVRHLLLILCHPLFHLAHLLKQLFFTCRCSSGSIHPTRGTGLPIVTPAGDNTIADRESAKSIRYM